MTEIKGNCISITHSIPFCGVDFIWQLVKNVFLKHERKFSRKVIEMVLAILLERKMSKWKILCSYLSKVIPSSSPLSSLASFSTTYPYIWLLGLMILTNYLWKSYISTSSNSNSLTKLHETEFVGVCASKWLTKRHSWLWGKECK